MEKTINLCVDYLRDCLAGHTIAWNTEEAIYYLENFTADILSLDHDLGGGRKRKSAADRI